MQSNIEYSIEQGQDLDFMNMAHNHSIHSCKIILCETYVLKDLEGACIFTLVFEPKIHYITPFYGKTKPSKEKRA
jgi:hypothetical protein